MRNILKVMFLVLASIGGVAVIKTATEIYDNRKKIYYEVNSLR